MITKANETYDATSVQQLTKIVSDGNGGYKDKNVYPRSIVQAIFDGKTGERLDSVLAATNCVYIPFQGTREATRLAVNSLMRRKGFIITFKDVDNKTYTQQYINDDSVADADWKADSNWQNCFTTFDDSEIVNELKQYIAEYVTAYVDEKLQAVTPPDGYEYVIANKSANV